MPKPVLDLTMVDNPDPLSTPPRVTGLNVTIALNKRQQTVAAKKRAKEEEDRQKAEKIEEDKIKRRTGSERKKIEKK